MRFLLVMSLAAIALAAPAAAESAPDTILRICKSEDLLMHAKSFKITPEYQAQICPCIVDQVKKAKPAEQQALADALKLPIDKRRTAMMDGNNRALSMGTRAFLKGQMVCAKKFPPKKH